MKYRKIPGTDFEVSPICLGTMTFGTPVVEQEAVKLTLEAIEQGINFIDTANMYEGYSRYAGSPGGVAEEILGKALKGMREKVILATKAGNKVGEAPDDEGTSRSAIQTQLHRSLKRLKTDYIDIYYLHKPDPDTPLEESISAINDAIEQGKIRYYGISNHSSEQTALLLKTARDNNFPLPVVHQPPYSLLKTDAEKDLFPLLEKEKIAAVPYQILQGGILTGKYRRGHPFPQGSRKAEKPEWALDLTDEVFDRLEQIEKQAKSMGRSMLEHTLKETLSRPAVVSVVVGAKRIDQLTELVEAVQSMPSIPSIP